MRQRHGCVTLAIVYFAGCMLLDAGVDAACTHPNCVHGWYSQNTKLEQILFWIWALGFPILMAFHRIPSATDNGGKLPAAPRPQVRLMPTPSAQVWTAKEIRDHFGISYDYFMVKYNSYSLALKMSGKSSNWNADIDGFAREKGALAEKEIQIARTDFNRAVLNRVKLALTMDAPRR
jgi:hypothetical protein